MTPRISKRAGEALKDLVWAYPGKLPAYHLRLKVRRSLHVPRLRRLERREERRAREAWGRRPTATVATIIPTYRRPEQLLAAVESVLAQTFRDQVVIVIDDGGGLPILPDDERLHVYTLNEHSGVAGVVRNVGIRASASEYIAFLDDDNEWFPEHLEVSLAAHQAGAEMTYTAMERVLADGSHKDKLSIDFDRSVLRRRGIVDTNVLVVRRHRAVMFSRLPLRRGDFPLEDWELVYRLSRRFITQHLPEVTARYLVHDDSFFTDWRAIGELPALTEPVV